MKPVRFSEEKDQWLRKERGIGFVEMSESIKKDQMLRVINHPNKKKFPKQKIFLVQLKSYIYVVPFVEESGYIFLKTVYASRKYTKKYMKTLKVNK